MPPGTRLRNVRIADDLWNRARAVAAARDEALSEVLRTALERYVRRHELTSSPAVSTPTPRP